MALDQLKAFISEHQRNKELINAIRIAATANEIAEIASEFGYQFSGEDLKAVSKKYCWCKNLETRYFPLV